MWQVDCGLVGMCVMEKSLGRCVMEKSLGRYVREGKVGEWGFRQET